MGRMKVKIAEKNQFGVLDHDVTLPSGVKVYNPMRVFPNNDGSELVFTLYRRPKQINPCERCAIFREFKEGKRSETNEANMSGL